MRFNHLINRFNFGEVSPLLVARTDLVKYQSGCRTLENFIPLLQGPVRRRGGTRFVAKSGNHTNPVLLLEFAFSETTSYIIEAGNNYLRFFHQGSPVLASNGAPYQIASPWAQSDLFLADGLPALKYVQSGDVMYIVCPGKAPQKLSRHGHQDWRITTLGGWTSGKARPNATAIALFRERLCLASGQTIYMSQSGAFENFTLTENQTDSNGDIIVPIAADDPIEINVYSEQMDEIEWLCPGRNLLVGTAGGEFVIEETTTIDPLGPENVKVSPETAFGSSPLQALRIGSVVLFVQRAGRKLREFAYDYSGDRYAAMDITVAAEHLTKGGLNALAWQSEPVETLWATRPTGELLGFTYSREQDMHAWHRHLLGGSGHVSHLAVIPARHGGRDELWLSVRRVVNGQTVYYLETMEPGLEDGQALAEAFFLDAGVTVRGNQLTEVSGLGHLEGCEVAILADGGIQPRRVVAGGKVTLQSPANTIHVGLPYDSTLTTLNLHAEARDGSIQGRTKRFTKVRLRLVESAGGAAGPPDNLTPLEYRRSLDETDQALSLFSGDRLINWNGAYETDGSLTVVQNFPLPFTLAAIIPEVIVTEV